jgi:Fe2+ or Zn2+ uptake regulation protein
VTPQRELILDTLCGMNMHATIGELYEKVHLVAPAIDRATVYRTINLFHELGLVVSAEIGPNTVYEVADEQPHHHLVCRDCGGVDVLDHHHFAILAHHLKAEHNFIAEIDHLTISGVCADCQ